MFITRARIVLIISTSLDTSGGWRRLGSEDDLKGHCHVFEIQPNVLALNIKTYDHNRKREDAYKTKTGALIRGYMLCTDPQWNGNLQHTHGVVT